MQDFPRSARVERELQRTDIRLHNNNGTLESSKPNSYNRKAFIDHSKELVKS